MTDLHSLKERIEQAEGPDRDAQITELLQAAQKPETLYLWVPSDAITFTPQVSGKVYGDGRALFGIGTINSRPAYWIVRGDSSWTYGYDLNDAPDGATEIVEMIDEITLDLEHEFGRPNDGEEYDYNSAGRPYDVASGRLIAWADIKYPVVNYGGGAHWFRLDWPDLPGVELVPHPLSPDVRILAEPTLLTALKDSDNG